MTKIQQVSNEIRQLLHDSSIAKTKVLLNKSKGFWSQLWTSLDTIDDTESAIKSFQDLSPESYLKDSFIQAYGLLQTLFVQQDAVSNLKESISGENIKWHQEDSSISLVRTIRNESTGHPTKTRIEKGSNTYCVIDKDSLTKEGFTYSMWADDRFIKKGIRFQELIEKQAQAIHKHLSELLTQIKKAEAEHKKRFEGNFLSSYLPVGEPYSLSLLRGIAYDELAWVAFQRYKETFMEIKKGLESRYGPLESATRIPGIKLLIDELNRIFFRIEELKNKPDVENIEIDLGIYGDAFVERLKELQTHLIEIDEEFSKK